MNINELFGIQKALDKRIIEERGLGEYDLTQRKLVNIIHSLGRCIGEAGFFIYWKDARANIKETVKCDACYGRANTIYTTVADDKRKENTENISDRVAYEHSKDSDNATKRAPMDCRECNGTGKKTINPLLNEYIHLLSSVISVANDMGYTEHEYKNREEHDLNTLTLGIANSATALLVIKDSHVIEGLLNMVISLGYKMGITESMLIDGYKELKQ